MTIPNSTAAAHNSDPIEIEKFSAHAHQWWDEKGELRTLHELNPIRLAWISKQAGGLENKTVLDIGCGGGILAESMAQSGAASVTGIDLAEKSLKVAKLHALDAQVHHVHYACISAEAYAAQHPASADVVTCMELLEHVPDPASVVRAAAAICKPGGVVIFSTINRNAKAWALAIVAAEYVLNLVPRGTHEFAKLIKPSELLAWCRDAGLIHTATSGVEYNPLTRRMSLSTNADVNYMVCLQRAA